MSTVLELPSATNHPPHLRHCSLADQAHTSEKSNEVDLEAIESAVETILRAVGEDPNRPGLQETPRRVAKMYAEMFAGLHLDPARHLHVTFTEEYDELVLVRDIPFTSMCEHHLLPFTGVAHVGYIPEGHVTGLSKLARVVEEVARRPQVQERMTHTIAELIENDHAMMIHVKDSLYQTLLRHMEETGETLRLKCFSCPTTVENLAHQLFTEITEMGFRLSSLEIRETDTSVVSYTREDWVNDNRYFASCQTPESESVS